MDSVVLRKNNTCKTILTVKKKARKKKDLKRKEASRKANLVKVNQTCNRKKVNTLSRMVPFIVDNG